MTNDPEDDVLTKLPQPFTSEALTALVTFCGMAGKAYILFYCRIEVGPLYNDHLVFAIEAAKAHLAPRYIPQWRREISDLKATHYYFDNA